MHETGPLAVLVCAAALTLGPCRPAAADDGDSSSLSNLAACYADGIDMIGAGKTEGGVARWRDCFADDLTFTLRFGPTFAMTCPGDKCPIPGTMSGVERRAAAARSTYDRAGYVATSHHLTSLGIRQTASDRAEVTGHLQAWHVRKDGGTVLGLGTWAVEARKIAGGWRIVEETLESPIRVVIPKAE